MRGANGRWISRGRFSNIISDLRKTAKRLEQWRRAMKFPQNRPFRTSTAAPSRFHTWGNSGIEPYPGPGNQLSKDRQGPMGPCNHGGLCPRVLDASHGPPALRKGRRRRSEGALEIAALPAGVVALARQLMRGHLDDVVERINTEAMHFKALDQRRSQSDRRRNGQLSSISSVPALAQSRSLGAGRR
jgi:hypothetical protein